MNPFSVLPPFESCHAAEVFSVLPNVMPGSEEHLYYLDQVNRFSSWQFKAISVTLLNTKGAIGTEHGPVLCLPWSFRILTGLDTARRAQRQGSSSVAGFVGLTCNSQWQPISQLEKRNQQIFSLLEDFPVATLYGREKGLAAILLREVSLGGWDPNAVSSRGESLLSTTISSLSSLSDARTDLVSASIEMLDRGADPNALCKSYVFEEADGARGNGKPLFARTPFEQLVNTFNEDFSTFSFPLYQAFKRNGLDFSLESNQRALDDFSCEGKGQGAREFSALLKKDRTMERASRLSEALPASSSEISRRSRF